ncbi:MAG TPA: ABC transporter permease, partial [Promineifilum sp.]|nr:ABC transporter permease [Promineifilum sp.]
MKGMLGALRQLGQYPTAVIGMIIIGLLLIVSIITPIIIPYNEAVRLWRGGEDVWRFYPRNAAPAWTNWFRSTDQAASVIIDSSQGDIEPTIEQLSTDTREARYSFEFDFPYDTFPPEMILFAAAKYAGKQPFVELTWITPDGREIRAG